MKGAKNVMSQAVYNPRKRKYVDRKPVRPKPGEEAPILRAGPFHVGQLADHVLIVMKKTGRRPLKPPEKIGEDEASLTVKWFLPDATLTMKRANLRGPYVVAKIEIPEGKGGENA